MGDPSGRASKPMRRFGVENSAGLERIVAASASDGNATITNAISSSEHVRLIGSASFENVLALAFR
jgi:hypothetical protein